MNAHDSQIYYTVHPPRIWHVDVMSMIVKGVLWLYVIKCIHNVECRAYKEFRCVGDLLFEHQLETKIYGILKNQTINIASRLERFQFNLN